VLARLLLHTPKKPNQIGWATAFLTTEITTEIVAK
jgi:hypothetical protein